MTFFVGENRCPFPDADAAMRYVMRRPDRVKGLEWNDLVDPVLRQCVPGNGHGD